ncbi:hypothetical protein MSMEG_6898 [Mycolicibacterium smegmatis MC2 155]|uniref:Uncharacterized protein n=1 Tax=Mycolicibacterium smegmatis (strain ATCC 700084 / mc(2)155) TaxID=246196 RepID=A0R7G0_MYCS2|nr:hypothetical protein MSMEG_6898 [Mycolicibacterium smegmatis MC2 155]
MRVGDPSDLPSRTGSGALARPHRRSDRRDLRPRAGQPTEVATGPAAPHGFPRARRACVSGGNQRPNPPSTHGRRSLGLKPCRRGRQQHQHHRGDREHEAHRIGSDAAVVLVLADVRGHQAGGDDRAQQVRDASRDHDPAARHLAQQQHHRPGQKQHAAQDVQHRDRDQRGPRAVVDRGTACPGRVRHDHGE